MEYHGKLYGKIWNRYFDTGRTSEEFDSFQKSVIELQLEKENGKCVNSFCKPSEQTEPTKCDPIIKVSELEEWITDHGTAWIDPFDLQQFINSKTR